MQPQHVKHACSMQHTAWNTWGFARRPTGCCRSMQSARTRTQSGRQPSCRRIPAPRTSKLCRLVLDKASPLLPQRHFAVLASGAALRAEAAFCSCRVACFQRFSRHISDGQGAETCWTTLQRVCHVQEDPSWTLDREIHKNDPNWKPKEKARNAALLPVHLLVRVNPPLCCLACT